MIDQPSTGPSSAAATTQMQDNPTEAKTLLRADVVSEWSKLSPRGARRSQGQWDAGAIAKGRGF